MKYTVSLFAALAALASTAHAQQVGFRQGDITFGYSQQDVENSDEPLRGYSVAGALDFALAAKMGLQFNAGYANLEYEDDDFKQSFDFNTLDAHLYGNLTPDFRLGAFAGRLDLGDYADTYSGSFDLDDSATAYGAEFLARQGALGYGAYVGGASIDDVDNVDTSIYGLQADYAVTSAIEVFGDYDGMFIESDEYEAEATISTVSAGVGYYLEAATNLPMKITASVSRSSTELETDDDSGKSDTTGIALGATFLLGGETKTADRRKLFNSISVPF